MIHSMTGYGKASAECPNKKIIVEIKSLNSKQFDLFTRIPFVYRQKEIALRNYLNKELERGKVDLTISMEQISKDVSSKIDISVLEQYYQELKNVSQKLGVAEPHDWLTTLLRLPDVIRQDMEEFDETEWKTVEEALEKATAEVIAFRIQEGNMLSDLLTLKVENIRSLLQDIEPFEAERIEYVKNKITENIISLGNIDYDKNRLEQEMIYYIEKLDVNEEKNRLTNHLNYFLETLKEKTSQGKKLGFIAQEMGREINTLGSKSNHSEMQRVVVRMKDELEQIKEQILNVL
ncbi:MAG: YicC family protein [Dysgonamonadaceae bacterium]|nr:YicC family protein [Dysgonamonadaceae bacterium]